VAALVEEVRREGMRLVLANTDPLQGHDVVVQAGGFGEHAFVRARDVDAGEEDWSTVQDKHLLVQLGPGSEARIDVEMARFVNDPSYAFPPWERVTGAEQRKG
jgi:hypothetical protein